MSHVHVTGTAQKAAWDAGVLPEVEQVGPGLWSIPVPIPNNPLRYVLVYALELDDGVAIVDAGWDTDEAYGALCDGLAVAGGSIADVRAILVTHIHPDHYGLAGRVREASGGWIGLHPEDATMIHARYVQPEDLLARTGAMLADSGAPSDRLPDLEQASMMLRAVVRQAEPDVFFEDGKSPELPGWDLRAIWTPGHSPGHVCFWSDARRMLLAGDHLLPRITSSVAVHHQQHDNPLADFLDSLLKIRELDAVEVLPAHEWRFAGIGARVDELIAHHAHRFAQIEDLLLAAPGSTAWDVTTQLTWSRPWEDIQPFMQRAANGETLAHLLVLERQDRVRREGSRPWRFYATDRAVGTGGAPPPHAHEVPTNT